jgi:hypothetical protein
MVQAVIPGTATAHALAQFSEALLITDTVVMLLLLIDRCSRPNTYSAAVLHNARNGIDAEVEALTAAQRNRCIRIDA